MNTFVCKPDNLICVFREVLALKLKTAHADEYITIHAYTHSTVYFYDDTIFSIFRVFW